MRHMAIGVISIGHLTKQPRLIILPRELLLVGMFMTVYLIQVLLSMAHHLLVYMLHIGMIMPDLLELMVGQVC
jgi:hypothetical protein